ncbi:hypothetical protein GH714_023776 [Hevea brasiliensis]|uniref:GDPGP1-like N-terminal domain-containing protein n=1 Tax=Hevea brasiliensis TaxID=3981 RepID=A0A6A6MLJ8_HEVBR|nr:hypothetical protein GH714_023776 [Hevea brasiliensis]
MNESFMLRIKRVPTVVSNFQKEEAEEGASRNGGCGRNCLQRCCIQGAKLPLYAFKKLNEKEVLVHENNEPPVAFLDSLLLGEWEDRMQRGLFRYDVTACETKVIPGQYGFIAQLNEGRHLKKRPTEFRVDKVLQPFDGNKFNFTKVGQEEVLFQFESSEDGDVHFFPSASIDVDNSTSVVAINVSPIEYGHVLLIPRILECLPQRIDRESFLLALYMAAEAANPYFRLGYNSLGAFATINHLHFQCYAEKQALGEVSPELLDTQVNPAVWEISGHMVLKRKKDYEEASEENAWKLLAEVSLSEASFQEVNALIFEVISCSDNDSENEAQDMLEDANVNNSLEEVDAINKGSHCAMQCSVWTYYVGASLGYAERETVDLRLKCGAVEISALTCLLMLITVVYVELNAPLVGYVAMDFVWMSILAPSIVANVGANAPGGSAVIMGCVDILSLNLCLCLHGVHVLILALVLDSFPFPPNLPRPWLIV